jgi:hypothetical protein
LQSTPDVVAADSGKAPTPCLVAASAGGTLTEDAQHSPCSVDVFLNYASLGSGEQLKFGSIGKSYHIACQRHATFFIQFCETLHNAISTTKKIPVNLL